MAPREAARPPRRHHDSGTKRHKKRKSTQRKRTSTSEDVEGARRSLPLSADALAQLNRESARRASRAKRESASKPVKEPEKKPKRPRKDGYREARRVADDREDRHRAKRKRRVVSGAILEEGRGGRGLRGGAGTSYDSLEKDDHYSWPERRRRKKKRLWIYIGIGVTALIIIIVVAAVVISQKKSDNEEHTPGLDDISPDSIPPGAPPWLNPFKWLDTTDFNVTYTNQMVGDLPVMGLTSHWDDSKAANEHVPALENKWGSYADKPARGVNIGGWLSLEPFITPSLFNYDLSEGIIDEYTLCKSLGPDCAGVLEKHYSTFVTEQTFKDIADAGLDHVRIPFSYWAVETYEGDPYVFRTSWRYLLRGIEWARKHGLRVNLDLHGLPGSQNGWNHSGRQGAVGWLSGSEGDLNGKRSLDIHDRLSKFFAQDRYRNIISHYGLANEPKMTFLPPAAVIDWTSTAFRTIRANGVKDAIVVFGDGFMGLQNWQGQLSGPENLALDVHQYVIFNTNQVVFNHTAKIQYACDGWSRQTEQSMNPATGFGPTLVAEWSQADTDCARHLTNVGWGNRWTGTYRTGNASLDVDTPRCPTTDDRCDCDQANADAGSWSDDYKQFLRMFAEAQMSSFEKGWGWFYWVWDTESAPQWSYKKGMAAGILPGKAYDRSFDCTGDIPSFSDLPEYY